MQKIRAAFTLFELIIVIVIIGAVYLLFFAGINTPKTQEVKDFAALKDIILQKTDGKSATMLCSGDECEKCVLYFEDEESTNKVMKELGFDLFGSRPKIFEYDRFGYLYEKKYHDDVCFEYRIYDNMSSSNMLVEKDAKYYLFYSFSKKAALFSDYDEAVKKFDPANTVPTSTNEYYYERR